MKDPIESTEYTSIIDRACAYARMGLKVFPTRGKVVAPGVKWTETASSSVSDVVQMFTDAVEALGEEWLGIGWALGLNGYIALDLDVDVEPEWWREVAAVGVQSVTGRGHHLIFKNKDNERTCGNSIKRFPCGAPWGEVRGWHGYICIWWKDRPGLDASLLAGAVQFPRPEWLTPPGASSVDAVTDHEAREYIDSRQRSVSVEAEWLPIKKTIDDWKPGDARHEVMLSATMQIILRSVHLNVDDALNYVHDWFIFVTRGDRSRNQDAEAEFTTAVNGAVAQLKANPNVSIDTKYVSDDDWVTSMTMQQLLAEPGYINPVTWDHLWSEDRSEVDWIIPLVWPVGSAAMLSAGAKQGKSEFILYGCIQVARGIHPWTGQPITPRRIAYIDLEMTIGNVQSRLLDFGVPYGERIANMLYYIQPAVGFLDNKESATRLVAEMVRQRVDAVVIDTTARVLEGDENEANTIAALDNYFTYPLKGYGIATLRSDHTGKDETRGARGSSAKNSGPDVIWKMKRLERGAKLEGMHRQSLVPHELYLVRLDDGDTTRYEIAPLDEQMLDEEKDAEALAWMESVGLPADLGANAAFTWLKSNHVTMPRGYTRRIRRLQPGRS